MYDYFIGTIADRGPMHCVVEVGTGDHRVGYHLTISAPCSETLEPGVSAKIYAHLHVRDIEQRLFGFASREERSMFRLLLTVSGVGPSLAIKLLSGCPHDELRRVIEAEDLGRLKKVRGVGAKTAQRILVDLKGAIAGLAASDDGVAPGTTGDAPEFATARGRAVEDALLALIALGYPRASAEKALRKVHDDGGAGEAADDWVRSALRRL